MQDLCDVVETLLLEGRDGKEREEFYQMLHEPLRGMGDDGELRRLLGV